MTVTGIRDGERYPDLRTLARLERAAGYSLLPDWTERAGSVPAGPPSRHSPHPPSPHARDDEETG
jgi:hypothetical protein